LCSLLLLTAVPLEAISYSVIADIWLESKMIPLVGLFACYVSPVVNK
jgi:hypothetical protein